MDRMDLLLKRFRYVSFHYGSGFEQSLCILLEDCKERDDLPELNDGFHKSFRSGDTSVIYNAIWFSLTESKLFWMIYDSVMNPPEDEARQMILRRIDNERIVERDLVDVYMQLNIQEYNRNK